VTLIENIADILMS